MLTSETNVSRVIMIANAIMRYRKKILFLYIGGQTMDTIKIGIIGTGRVAQHFVEDVRQVKGVTITAICNPQLESAADFAKKNNIEHYTDHMEKMAAYVDAVYIALPREKHYIYAKRMLNIGKHVMCLNPLTFSKAHVEELCKIALEKELGCKVMPLSALHSEGSMEVAEAAIQLAKIRPSIKNPHVFTGSVEHAIAHIEESIEPTVGHAGLRWAAVKVLLIVKKRWTMMQKVSLRVNDMIILPRLFKLV